MKAYAHKTGHSVRHPSGAALIITLAMLILVSFVVVAFLGRSTREAVLVSGSVGGQEADILANSAAELIIADLKSEMRAGSTETIDNGIAIMEPDTAVTAMPSQARLSATSGAVFDNLIKQSGAPAGMFLNTAPYNKNSVTELIPAATTTPTTTASVDGRTVSEARWNAPQLLVGGNFTTAQVPNWVLMDRVGIAPSQSWSNAFKDRTPTNDSFIIGRFAYNIYDVSGLLDINVAGYPSGVTTADSARKGSLAMAALENIPGITSSSNASLFVKDWRNKVTGTSATNFLSFLGLENATTNAYYNFGPKYGFQKVATSGTDSDNRILSRQDLIKLATNGSNGISTAALPYLTHFSRAVSAPSWSPATPAGSSTNYNADRNEPGPANRFLANVRVSGTFTRADGTAAQIGEPLLKSRFPLSRLAGLGRTGVNTTGNTTIDAGVAVSASVATVQRDFGLFWSSDRWNYAGPSGSAAQSAIKTLAQVTSDNREPNFFELLKASILSGSLGKIAGTSRLLNSTVFDALTDDQIIQIGANIIDQYDANSYPTKINFNGNDYTGVENLPYLNRMLMQYYRLTTDPGNNRGYFLLELFNPHRPKANTIAPTNFRVLAKGKVSMHTGSLEDSTKAPNVYNYGAFQPDSTPGAERNTDASITPPATIPNGLKSVLGPDLATSPPLQFSVPLGNTNLFTWPALLTQRVAGANVTSSGDNSITDGSVQFVGFNAGQVTCSSNIYGNYKGSVWNPCYGGYMETISPLSFFLQYQDPGGSWVNYSAWQNFELFGMWDGGGNRPVGDSTSPGLYYQVADPRSSRFGLFWNYCHDRTSNPAWTGPTYQDSLGLTSRPDSTATADAIWAALPYGVPFNQGGPPPSSWGPSPMAASPDGGTSYRFGYLAENKTTLPTYYRDNDNILRNGDAAYASGAWGQPLEQVNSAAGLASRPVILDRPFRSVAEMGYAFRDLPYKSVDFFTENSADAALLDVFSVNESPVSGVTAGVLNPNTRHKPVLKAVLANVLKNELDPASTLDPSPNKEVDNIVTKITTATAGTPLKNPSDIAARIPTSLASGDFSGNDATIKARRESVVRALADVSNTRTWNLLVDLVMQSGRYPNSATAVDKFSVDGERRYWLHLAIDRYTGQVVARSMEPVNE